MKRKYIKLTDKQRRARMVNTDNAMEYYLTTPNATVAMMKSQYHLHISGEENKKLMTYLKYWGARDLYIQFRDEKMARESITNSLNKLSWEKNEYGVGKDNLLRRLKECGVRYDTAYEGQIDMFA